MARPVHVMLRVLEEARSLAFYEQAFGLKVVGRYAFDDFTLIYVAGDESPFELELTVNKGRAEPYVLGDAYGHMAVVVEDIAAEHARLSALGLSPKPVVEFLREGAMFARFFFVEDPDGYRIEVIQKAGRFG